MQPMMLDVIAVHIDVAQLELEDLAVALAAWRRGQGERHRQRRNRRFLGEAMDRETAFLWRL